MSYDLRIAVKVKGVDEDVFAIIAMPEYHSPTYNLGGMFRLCMGWDFKQGEFYNVEEVYPLIEWGIDELTNNEGRYIPMNPDNGWGNTKSALKALVSLKRCIDGIIDPDDWESGWNTLPKNLLWVAW